MTVNRLHKLLGQMIRNGYARRQVLVNKETFTDNLEADGCVILPISGAIATSIGMFDDDGFTKTRADGRECMSSVVILFGTSGEPDTGMSYKHSQSGGATA